MSNIVPINTSEENLPENIRYAYMNLGEHISSIPTSGLLDYGFSDEFYSNVAQVLRSPEYCTFTCKHILGINLLPLQAAVLRELWIRPFPLLIASRGFGKSFLTAIHAILRALLLPGRKVVITGAAFRQAKVVFEYCESIWYAAPILRDLAGQGQNQGPKRANDMWSLTIGDSRIIALPLGTGEKIRGQRAHDVIADEFASIRPDIFEIVIGGFGIVSSSPFEKVKAKAVERALEKMGRGDEIKKNDFVPNQTLISGTAYYDFNHFADYYRKYRKIITSKGDPNKIEELFGDAGVPPGFNWKDYSIIRIPIGKLDDGYFDMGQVARNKVSNVVGGTFDMEYNCIFSKDSAGFFRRTTIEACTTNKPIVRPISGPVQFEPSLVGDRTKQHVFGVDPASEEDNFSIVVLELNPDHRKVVYCWTTQRKTKFKEQQKTGVTKETSFYDYTCRKIRDLMKMFPCAAIALDMGGGGISVLESLHNPKNIKRELGEVPIWPIIDDSKERDSDFVEGLHILHEIHFQKYDWVAEANHSLKNDLEQQALLFPSFDDLSYIFAEEEDRDIASYDSLEDCIFEIQEMKDELCSIIVTKTPTGKDKWDTPDIKLDKNRKGKSKKDRYSALLMANMIGRQLTCTYSAASQYANEIDHYMYRKVAPNQMYTGADWYSQGMTTDVPMIIRRQ